jgi:undecaprenyl-diphosphatase
MSLIDRLDALDRAAFLALNGLHAPALDDLMWHISELQIWIPLYLFFLYLLRQRWGWRGLGIAVPVLALMIFTTDTGSVVLFKNTVQRLRPSHVAELQAHIHLLYAPDGTLYRGGSFGFVSSHASNHFGIAAFMMGVLGGRPAWAMAALLLWAALISYSRIYLGVHYPGDVLVGGAYGFVVGSLAVRLFRRLYLHQGQARP